MSVTAAQLGRHSKMRGVQEGELAGNRQVKSNPGRPLRRSFPNCSFDGHNNFVWTHHVQPAASGDFDGAWVGTQLFNFQSQRAVRVPQSLDIRLHANVLIGCHGHPGACPHRYRDADGKCSQDNHSKNYPGGY